MIERRRSQTIDVDARMGSSMAGWQSEVYLNLARLCLRSCDSDVPISLLDRYEHDHPTGISWTEHALLFTESRRAHTVLDSLQIQHSQRELVEPSSASIPKAIHKLRTLRSLLSLQSPTQAEVSEIAELQDEIRELENDDAISPAIGFVEEANTTIDPRLIYQSIPDDAVIIQITFGARGFIAFAVTKDGIQDLQQGPTRVSDIQKPVAEAQTVSVFAKSPNANPPEGDESNTRNESNGVNLHIAAIEAVSIARMFATWPVEASNLYRKRFCNYMEGRSSIIHIGTHGYVDPRNPLLSSISIGENFRVLDMSTIRSTACLLGFAACLSGLGKATLSTGVLGFSHVVLSSGCQAYIGALWELSDLASMMIMTLFYRYLKGNANIFTAEAIRQAQIEFMQLENVRAEELLTSMLEDWTAFDENGNIPADFAPDLDFVLSVWKMTLSQID
ncbi:hypothetical protein N7448_010990 [Penicillium atrosanguineum]|nr:hypothetical protein N7448_010990 [Penicillium atrosanguineum]